MQVTITFTALVLIELLNVAYEIRKWHWLMVWSEIITLASYFGSVIFLKGYFDVDLFVQFQFWVKLGLIVCLSMAPVMIAKHIRQRINPPAYLKLTSQ